MSDLSKSVFDRIGWGAEDMLPQNDKADAMEAYEAELEAWEQAREMHDLFKSPTGQRVLNRLYSMTIEEPAFTLGEVAIAGSIATLPAEQQGFIREGQNSIVRFIMEEMKAGQEPPPERPEIAEKEEAPEDGN